MLVVAMRVTEACVSFSFSLELQIMHDLICAKR